MNEWISVEKIITTKGSKMKGLVSFIVLALVLTGCHINLKGEAEASVQDFTKNEVEKHGS